MGDCIRSCKRSAEKEASNASFLLSKRRKLSVELLELELASPDNFELDKASTVRNSGDSSFSPCFSIESCDSLRLVDLEAKSFETEISTCINANKFSRETTPLSELCTRDSEKMESRKTPPPPPTTAKQAKTPSQAEIDEFFSVTEKYEQKRFAEKYNYDIVKDMPLDGLYQWVRLKP